MVGTQLLHDFGEAERVERGQPPEGADRRPRWRREAAAIAGRIRRAVDPNRPLTAEEGARTSVFVASAPEVERVSGAYYVECRATQPKPVATDSEVAFRLWEASALLVRPLLSHG